MEQDNNTCTGLEIAVVGMAGRFPGAKNIGEFWDNLINGRESISFFSTQELEETGIAPHLLGDVNYVKAKGVLEDLEYFDYIFFDYTRRESQWMDPQFRILHECTWHALEDAGYDPDNYPGAIGLYVGTLANYQWVSHLFNSIGNQSEQTIIGSLNDRDFLSTRTAYKLNLKGPALTVQTACSTSLVAIHMGCQSLLSGESDMVVVGGSSVWLPKRGGYLYEAGMIRSADGKCRAFDANANGTNGGDGVAMVVLKRLTDALEDKDRIDAVIKGSAINNDGRRKVGYTAPSVEGQAEVIRAAMQMAEVDPESITMIEAHGTATALGDPVEIEALKRAFASEKRQFCAIGSVKTNVGHLDAVSGAAGFIKAVLALKHRLIPPSLHFEIPNPRIDFEYSPFYVNTKILEWTSENTHSPLRAGVSSFGLGGTNAHVILEESPRASLSPGFPVHVSDEKEKSSYYHLFPLSAKTRNALERLTQNLGVHLNAHPALNLADAAYTLQLGRKPFKFRKTLVCQDIHEAIAALSPVSPQVVEEPLENPRVVFMFSGQGAQYVNMGLDLYHYVPLFAEETDRCFHILESLMTANLKEVLYPSQPSQTGNTEHAEGSTAEIHQFVYASPIKFVFDYSLARLLMKWGIQPYAMIGHSFGEYVAACLSGVLSLEDALKLVVERGRLMQQMPDGAMMNVPLSEAELQPYLNDELSLAALNEPGLCIVSGTLTAVKVLEEQLTGKGLECMRLRVPKAGHSSMVEPFLDEFRKTLHQVTFNKPGIPYTSGLSGKWITVEEAVDPLYWLYHMRQTNRFSDGLVELFKEPDTVFIEVGSGRGLTLFVNRHPGKGPGHRALNLVKHHKETISDVSFLLDKIGRLWSMGINIDWQVFYHGENRCRVSLPLYPFDRHYFSVDIAGYLHQQEVRRKSFQDTVIQPDSLHKEKEAAADSFDPVEEKTAAVLQEVLGLDQVRLDKDFFELGGDSLTAVMASSKISKAFGVEFSVKVILSGSTIKEIAQKIRELDKLTYTGILPAEKRDHYPLSSAQKRLFFLDRFEDISTTYNMPYVLKIVGDLDKKQLENSFHELIRKHETLRTSFNLVEDTPVQKVHEIDCLEFEIEHYFTVNDTSFVLEDYIKPFNLSLAPLIRVGLVEAGKTEYLLVLDMHHIITDGTSMGLLVNEFTRFYEGREIQPLNIQYKDFSQWQNYQYQTGRIKKQEEFWLNLFPDSLAVPVLDLPLDFPRPDVFTYEGDSYGFTLEAEETQRFKEMALACDATLYMNLLAAFFVLLSRYSGQDDIVVGSAVAGRSHADLQDLIGMFVNMLAMRNQPVETLTYLEFLEAVRSNCLAAFENQDLQFEDLVDKLELERDTARNPLFSVSFLLQNFEQPEIKIKDTTVTLYEYWNKVSRFDMSVLSYEREGGIYFRIMYYRRIFKRKTIEQMARHFLTVIKLVGKQPDTSIAGIELLSQVEKYQLLHEFNLPGTEAKIEINFPIYQTVDQLFEEQAVRTPDRAAVVFGDNTITYRFLDEQSNQLANYLNREIGIRPDQAVALLLDHSVRLPMVIWGILKAGGAYVPMDTTLPRNRIKGMLWDMEANLVISQKKYIGLLQRLQWECPLLRYFLCIDTRDIHGEEEPESQLMDEKLWEYVGETSVDDITGGGWNTSYTGEPFSREEMDEYGDNVLKKLAPLLGKHVRVLEIGCASGITMYRIAPQVGFYYGTDLSRVIIEKNKEQVRIEGHKNIELAVVPAHEIEDIAEANFDIIIMNSVIQNFHGHNYFRKVIRKCIGLLPEKGRLFIGDIMDQDRKEALEQEMRDFKQANQGKGYRTTTDFSDALFLSQGYFEDLALEFPEIKSVEFSSKIFTIENELTKFRYDTLISVDKTRIQGGKPARGSNFNVNDNRQQRQRHKYQHDLQVLTSYPELKIPGPPIHGVNHLAYVIYTSGSTGHPKGVLVEHKNVVHLVTGLWQRIYSKYNTGASGLRVCMVSPYMFDASVKQIFAVLLLGHTLCIIDKETRVDGEALLAYYQKYCIRFSDGTPVHLRLLLEAAGENFPVLATENFIIGGEALPLDLAREFLHRFNQEHTREKSGKSLVITNVYGPTECTVDATSYEISPDNIDRISTNTIPIGTPLYNVRVYITGLGERKNRLQPKGVAGELCIGGGGTARGYLKQPELTFERFDRSLGNCENDRLKNRKAAINSDKMILPGVGKGKAPRILQGQKLYRSGDLARWLREGLIEFLGRLDQQVKIRGFRIELGEIEHRLRSHEDVKEAAVAIKERNGDTYLCAYIVSLTKTPIETRAIRDHLATTLPEYMIPTDVVTLERLPLTSSGKLDRSALPNPDFGLPAEGYVPPANETQEILVKAWQEVLGIPRLGVADHFFEIGGDSIKAIQVSSRLKKYGFELRISHLFLHPVIGQLDKYVTKTQRVISQETVQGEVVLTPIQRRFFQSNFTDSHYFNQAVMLYHETGFDVEIVKKVTAKLTEHHDALRMVYKPDSRDSNRLHQWNRGLEDELFDLELFDLKDTQEDAADVIENLVISVQASIDLAKGPLVKLGLFKTACGDHLLMVIHHLVVDGISWRILLEDFSNGYQQVKQGKEIEFPVKTHSFQYWSRELTEYAVSNNLLKEMKYWGDVEAAAAQIERLPKDFEIGCDKKKQKYAIGVTINLREEETELLLKKVNRAYNTEINDILLTALAMAVKEWSGLDRILINLEGHGRESVLEGIDISRTVGWFTSLYPVILDLSQIKDLSYAVRHVKEILRRVPNKGIGYGILKYLTPREKRQTWAGPLEFKSVPEIYFNYLGQFGQESQAHNSFIKISSLKPGANRSPEMERRFSIDINGMVVEGKLSLLFTYNQLEYKKENMEILTSVYRRYLLDIIEHCRQKEEKELTPSDLGYAGIEIEEIDAFEDEFSDLD